MQLTVNFVNKVLLGPAMPYVSVLSMAISTTEESSS